MKFIFGFALLLLSAAVLAAPFTFQGAIDDDGQPLTGSADLVFSMHAQAVGGSPIAGPVSFPGQPVHDGVFSVELDFPGLVFDGSPRYLETSVDGQTLLPRIEIQAAPLSGSTLSLRGRSIDAAAPQVGEALVWDGSAWSPEAVGSQFSAGTGLVLNGETFRVAPSYRLPQGCGGDQLARWNGSQWTCSDDLDQDTLYTAGTGLTLSAQQFAIDFAGSGTNDTAARSDHGHYGARYEGNQSSFGLEVVNIINASLGFSPTGVSGQAIGDGGVGVLGSGEIGVMGESYDVGVSGVTLGDEGEGVGILGSAETTDGEAVAIRGIARSPDAFGLLVNNYADSGFAYGIYSSTSSPEGVAILGNAYGGPSGNAIGVRGQTAAPFGLGMFASNTATSGPATALRAVNTAVGGTAVSVASLGPGQSRALEANSSGVSSGANAIRASLTDASSIGDAIYAFSQSASANAGRFLNDSGTAIALAGQATAFEATGNGVIAGDLGVFGTLSAAAKFFRIEHPLDPSQRFLQHAAIESDEMLTLYSGNVSTDQSGLAEVELPDWFEALNRDFRYQLTVIGSFARAIIGEEIRDGRFVIRTDQPEVKVSWQVTAIRQDDWALANPLEIEPVKNQLGNDQGSTASTVGGFQ